MGKITYTRGTTYKITHRYTAPEFLGVTLLFTVKTVPSDEDITDVTTSIMTPKTVAMGGASFPQSTVITIDPEDVAVTVDPAKNYAYSLKVIDSNGDEYAVDSGSFILNAISTNRLS